MFAAFLFFGGPGRPTTWLAIAWLPAMRPIRPAPPSLRAPTLAPLEAAAIANLCAALDADLDAR